MNEIITEEQKAASIEVVPEAPKESPAKDLREIQGLLVSGTYAGNMAPAVVKAFHLLETMAAQVERDASKVA